MRPARRAALIAGFLFFASFTTRAGAQTTQAVGGGRSLGGYGGAMTDTGMGGGPSIPYAGRFGGFMPYRMGGGSGDLSFQPRPSTVPTGPGRTPFALPSTSGGMGMGRGLGSGPRLMSPNGGMTPTSGSRGMGVMPPNFGYPFRQPPSLLSPSSSGAGMSM